MLLLRQRQLCRYPNTAYYTPVKLLAGYSKIPIYSDMNFVTFVKIRIFMSESFVNVPIFTNLSHGLIFPNVTNILKIHQI